MPADDAEARIHAFVAAFNDGAVGAVRQFIGTEFYRHRPGTAEPGAADVIHGLAVDLRRAMSDLRIEIHEVAPDDGGIAAGSPCPGPMTECCGAPPPPSAG